MKIEILWAIFLVTTAFGAVVARDLPPGTDLEVDDFMISEKEIALDYSNYTTEININNVRGTGIMNIQCQFDGQYLPHPSCCYKYVRCAHSTPLEHPCPPGTAWSQSNPPCDHDYKTNCGVSYNTCVDIGSDCPAMAANGKCDTESVFVKCKSSCACGIGSNPLCKDDDSVCTADKALAKLLCTDELFYPTCRSTCACDLKEGAAPVIPPPGGCSCGITDDKNRIIGGVTVDPEQKWPWQVGLRQVSGPGNKPGKKDKIFCGGSIINNKYVLTAAHCLHYKLSPCTYNPRTNLHVHIGEHDQESTKEDGEDNNKLILVDPKLIFIHPCYNCITTDNDFALLGLSVSIVFNDVITPICLPKDDSKTYVDKEATVAGWGLTVYNDFASSPALLQELGMTILDNNYCGPYDTNTITPNMLCAREPNDWTKSTCSGDSGGPLVVEDPKGSSRYVQVGVVSFGKKCNTPGYATVFGRVSKVLDWIRAKSASGQYCEK